MLCFTTAVMESDEPDAQSDEYMRDMYNGCMNESKYECYQK